MLSRPMSRALLVHSISHSSFIKKDSWGVEVFGDPETVKYVRYEYVKKSLMNSMGDSDNDKAILFVDAKNSSPVLSYKKDDKITFNGFDSRVREVAEVYGDNKKLHHLEIKLV